MQLALTRNEKKSIFGKTKYTLVARVQMTEQELKFVRENGLDKKVIFETYPDAFDGFIPELTLKRLIDGTKEMEHKDIAKIVGVEEKIKQFLGGIKDRMSAATGRSGEEVTDI